MADLVKNHTGYAGDRGLYTATFVFAMNKASYDKLPADLKKVIDNNSGVEAAAWAGRAMDGGDKVGLKKAKGKGNTIITIKNVDDWKKAAQPVVGKWIADMKAKGIDGAALVKEAKALVAKHTK